MTEPKFTITLAQLNPTVGDVTGNAAKARAARDKAKADGADLVVLPELFICGYPPEDLVLKPAFQAACRAAVEELARETAGGGPAMLIGTPWVEDGKLYNACALLDQGRIAALRFKANLPNYGVFDEKRLFARGPAAGPVTVQRRPGRRSHLRGHLARRVRGIRKRRRMPRRDRRGNPGGAERLALCARQERFAAVDRGRPRHRERPAAGLSQPDRRAGRTGVRRRVVRAQRRSFGRGATARVRGEHHHAALDQGRRRLALLRAGGAAGRGRQGRLRGLRAGPARLRPQERISRRAARRLRRHRFRAVRGDCGRRARRRPGPRRDAAVPIHRAGLARRCRQARESARLSLRGAADRGRRERIRKDPVKTLRRAAARHHRGEFAGAHPRHAA